MIKTRTVNFRSFKQKVRHHQGTFRRLLTRLGKNLPKKIDQLTALTEKEVWQEVDCLSCANCCKQMSPTYTNADIQRIAKFEKLDVETFKKKWLYKDKEGDWINRSTPCQFLDLESNKCRIYPVRPADCAGFPHLSKKKFADYIHVHRQNIEYCPATYLLVEKMMVKLGREQPGLANNHVTVPH